MDPPPGPTRPDDVRNFSCGAATPFERAERSLEYARNQRQRHHSVAIPITQRASSVGGGGSLHGHIHSSSLDPLAASPKEDPFMVAAADIEDQHKPAQIRRHKSAGGGHGARTGER